MDEEFSKFTELYISLMKGDKSEVIEKYGELGTTPSEAFSISGDSILHVAIYMRQESIAREILKRYNPPLDLGQQNALGDTVLHEAAAANMTSIAKDLLILAPELLSMQNHNEETPLFTAARFGSTEMFELLADLVEKKQQPIYRHLTEKDGSTLLHMAILAEFFDLALKIAMKYPYLIEIKNKNGNGMNGLQLLSKNPSAFKSGRKYGLLKTFIYYCIPSKDTEGKEDSLPRGNSELDPMHTVHPRFYSTVIRILTSVAGRTNMSIWRFLRQVWPMMERIYKAKKRHESAFKLAKFLIEKDHSWMRSSKKEGLSNINPNGEEIPPKPENLKGITLTPLLMATSTGIKEIVEEILTVYPQAVDHVTPDEGWNILHVAISHRQLEIFHAVKKMDIPMTRLVRRIDEDGYTILHHVGVMKYYTGGTLPGPVLQLQEELQWFERVLKIIPSHYEMHRCNTTHQIPQSAEAAQDKCYQEFHARIFKEVQEYLKRTSQKNEASQTLQTAREFFEQTHVELLKEAQEWLKRTSEACSAVAVLIATVAFAAAYTVPGGSNQETGVPILLHDPFFLVFTVMDVLSLASSLTSVVIGSYHACICGNNYTHHSFEETVDYYAHLYCSISSGLGFRIVAVPSVCCVYEYSEVLLESD
ncbi:uncharacterized protein LOC126727005 isoform X2 [Quercus robur]|uniref:uncharacterized protein LOC126727005 isoform X2 n=1 Tax=Quercus robur TaxID=38942 RepID=UPI002163D4A0|nr:uncharacterized protein LOC126727005 isoform X2 [Quercus robur]